MKNKLHMELLSTSTLAIVLTLVFAMMAFYGLFKEQVVSDLKADALVLKNMHVFDQVDTIHQDAYDMGPDSLRVTVIDTDGTVLFDSNADAAAMENHADRPEVKAALENGEGSGSRSSETVDKNLFYYAVRLDNGTVIRVSREADSLFAVLRNMMPAILGVLLLLFLLCFSFPIILPEVWWSPLNIWRRTFPIRERKPSIRSWLRLWQRSVSSMRIFCEVPRCARNSRPMSLMN